MKKVSVIVPVYNVDKFLEKCLRSLVAQTLDDLEIIIIDDGSTDGSSKIIEKFAADFPDRVRAFQKKNGGLSDARNYGLDRANGKYIGFVDSDDYVTPEMFREMYGLAEKYSAEMVVCNLQKVNETGDITQKLTQIPNMPECFSLSENFSVFSDLSYFACNKIFKADLFEGKRFKKGVHFEDIQLIPQLLLRCETVAQTQKYHYNYLERHNSISKTHTAQGLDMLYAVRDVSAAFRESRFSAHRAELKNFQILEGVYSFLAYLAFVGNADVYRTMGDELAAFMAENRISKANVLQYRRFGRNYILSLPMRKKIYYLLYFSGLTALLRTLVSPAGRGSVS